jgi:hypothetical protein
MSQFECSCGYDFAQSEDWDCWDLVGREITCPRCLASYRLRTEAYEESELEGSSDRWFLEKTKKS